VLQRTGFSGLQKATPEQVERSKNQVKMLTPKQITQLRADGKLESTFTILAEAQGLSVAALAKIQGIPVNSLITKKLAPSTYSIVSQNILKAPPTWIGLSPFYYYGQEEAYTCLPAGIRMTLRWINGTTSSESVVADGCGTAWWAGTCLANAVDYLNDMQDDQNYLVVYSASETTMKNHLYYTIAGAGLPALIGVYEDKGLDWPYELESHSVTAYSIASNKTGVMVCDPYADYMDEPENRWYYKAIGDLYLAFEEANSGYTW
jgi:hypothetical protein